jgi:L-fuconolactonase
VLLGNAVVETRRHNPSAGRNTCRKLSKVILSYFRSEIAERKSGDIQEVRLSGADQWLPCATIAHMAVIDAQVHTYERDNPRRPWAGSLPGPSAVTGDDMVEAMAKAGVDGALVVSPWTLYRSDTSYAVAVYGSHPGRFGLVAPIDPYEEGAVAAVTRWASTPGAVGVRLMAGVTGGFRPDDGEVREAIVAAGELPVCVFCPGQLSIMEQLASLYPNTQFVLDHLGLMPVLSPPPPENPFDDLNSVLALARYPNVAVKLTGLCTLSHRPFPFDDLWRPLNRTFDAFGIDRCMWGSDWTRALEFVTYAEAVAAFRDHLALSSSDRDALMGGTVRRIFGWPRID